MASKAARSSRSLGKAFTLASTTTTHILTHTHHTLYNIQYDFILYNRGHTSYVNQGVFTKDGLHIVTSSSDGTCKLWDVRTSECVLSFRPGQSLSGQGYAKELSVHTLIPITTGVIEMLFIGVKGPSAYLVSIQGLLIRTFSCGGADFLCCTVSPQGNWVYCVAEDGVMYIFNAHTGTRNSVHYIVVYCVIVCVTCTHILYYSSYLLALFIYYYVRNCTHR